MDTPQSESQMLNPEYRHKVLGEIQGDENKERKKESFRQTEIYNNRIDQYVYEYLCSSLSEETANKMPRINTINICRRMIEQRASLYKKSPSREFVGLSEQQIEKMNMIYEDMMIDEVLLKSNRLFELQNQNTLKIVPKNGRLTISTMPMHRVDAIPLFNQPEYAITYIESSYNRSTDVSDYSMRDNGLGNDKVNTSDMNNQTIADKDDFNKKTNYVWWDSLYNFLTDGTGKLLSEQYDNPIGMLPFVDVARGKDSEFFVRNGSTSVDFTVQYNAAYSSYWFVVQLQGFSIGILLTPADQDNNTPTEVSMGVAKWLHFTYDATTGQKPELNFVSPSPDLAGTQEFITSLVSNYLSAEGLDASTITPKGDSKSFSSGLERLLAMIESFEASKESQVVYERVEKRVFEIIKAWLNNQPDKLEEKYRMGTIPEDSKIVVEFQRPESIKTDMEKLAEWEKRLDLGSHSKLDMVMDVHQLDREDGLKKLQEIEGIEFGETTE